MRVLVAGFASQGDEGEHHPVVGGTQVASDAWHGGMCPTQCKTRCFVACERKGRWTETCFRMAARAVVLKCRSELSPVIVRVAVRASSVRDLEALSSFGIRPVAFLAFHLSVLALQLEVRQIMVKLLSNDIPPACADMT
jgi:hypothetical protein